MDYLDLLSSDIFIQVLICINDINILISLKHKLNNIDWKLLFQIRFPIINFNDIFIDINFNKSDISYYVIKYILLIKPYKKLLEYINHIRKNNIIITEFQKTNELDIYDFNNLSVILEYHIEPKDIDILIDMKIDINILNDILNETFIDNKNSIVLKTYLDHYQMSIITNFNRYLIITDKNTYYKLLAYLLYNRNKLGFTHRVI